MTKLLISVRDTDEAATALEAGADLIDIKEPRRGPLGRTDADTIQSIIAAVGRRRPVSAALGELLDGDQPAANASTAGLDFVKFGLAGCAGRTDWIGRWRQAVARCAPQTVAVAVVYADFERAGAPVPAAVIEAALVVGCGAILVDTFDKSTGGLLDRWSIGELASFSRAVRRHKFLLALAGSLVGSAIHRLVPLEPDYIAFRGAACHGGRSGAIDAERVRELAAQLRSA